MESDVMKAFNTALTSMLDQRPPVSKQKTVEITKAAMNAVRYFKHVIFALERFLAKCRAEYRLSGLYLIDSIVRQARKQYQYKDVFAPRFAVNLANTISNVLACEAGERLKVVRVVNLWQVNKIFEEDQLRPIFQHFRATGLEVDPLRVERLVKGEKANVQLYNLPPQASSSGSSVQQSTSAAASATHQQRMSTASSEESPASPQKGWPTAGNNSFASQQQQQPRQAQGEPSPSLLISAADLHQVITQVLQHKDNSLVEMLKDSAHVNLLLDSQKLISERIVERVEIEKRRQGNLQNLLSREFDYSDEEDDEDIRGALGNNNSASKFRQQALEGVHQLSREQIKGLAHDILSEGLDLRQELSERIRQQTQQQLQVQQQHTQQAGVGPAGGLFPFLPPGMNFSMPPPSLSLPAAAAAAAVALAAQVQQQQQLLPGGLALLPPSARPPPSLLSLVPGAGMATTASAPSSYPLPTTVATADAGGGNERGNAAIERESKDRPRHSTSSSGRDDRGDSGGRDSRRRTDDRHDDRRHSQSTRKREHGSPSSASTHRRSSRAAEDEVSSQAKSRRSDRERDRDRDRDRDRERGEERSNRSESRRSRERERERGRGGERGGATDDTASSESREKQGNGNGADPEREERERRKNGFPSKLKDDHMLIGSRTLWFGRLPSNCTEQDLIEAIREAGVPEKISIVVSRGCAYVTMPDRRSAFKIVDRLAKGLQVARKQVKLDWATITGIKDNQRLLDYWDSVKGYAQIPFSQLPVQLDHFFEGAWLEVSTLPGHLKGLYNNRGEKLGAMAANAAATTMIPTMQPMSAPTMGQLPMQIPLPPGAMGAVNPAAALASLAAAAGLTTRMPPPFDASMPPPGLLAGGMGIAPNPNQPPPSVGMGFPPGAQQQHSRGGGFHPPISFRIQGGGRGVGNFAGSIEEGGASGVFGDSVDPPPRVFHGGGRGGGFGNGNFWRGGGRGGAPFRGGFGRGGNRGGGAGGFQPPAHSGQMNEFQPGFGFQQPPAQLPPGFPTPPPALGGPRGSLLGEYPGPRHTSMPGGGGFLPLSQMGGNGELGGQYPPAHLPPPFNNNQQQPPPGMQTTHDGGEMVMEGAEEEDEDAMATQHSQFSSSLQQLQHPLRGHPQTHPDDPTTSGEAGRGEVGVGGQRSDSRHGEPWPASKEKMMPGDEDGAKIGLAPIGVIAPATAMTAGELLASTNKQMFGGMDGDEEDFYSPDSDGEGGAKGAAGNHE